MVTRTALLLALALPLAARAAVPERALELRNLGLAQLENEQPAEAEKTFRELAQILPEDPLGAANLAIAALRQQKSGEALEWIGRALEKAPGRGDLLAIQGEVLQWSNRGDEAVAAFKQAVAADPDDIEILYAFYRHASNLPGRETSADILGALKQLARLRPDNAVVLLQLGQKAIASGDRAGASRAFLRVRELLWQGPPLAERALAPVLQALEAGDLEKARVPALRLENVLKVTPMYQQGLRELNLGILGVPVTRFRDEPAAREFGPPSEVRFAGRRLDPGPTPGRGLAAADLDGDRRPDLARLLAGDPPRLELRLSSAAAPVTLPLPAAATGLLAADLDNDGQLDLLAHGPDQLTLLRGLGEGRFEAATEAFGLAGAGAAAAAVLDFDIEGDLDLALAGGKAGPGEIFRNALAGALAAVGRQALPRLDLSQVSDLVASDLDRDGDLDLLLAHGGGLALLANLRQGEFADQTAAAGLAGAPAARTVVSADLDNDGWPDLVAAGPGLALYRNRGGRFERLRPAGAWPASGEHPALAILDADNDGRLDLAAAGPEGVVVLGQRSDLRFEALPLADDVPRAATALVAVDLDGDGDQDLVAAGPAGLHLLDNDGGNRNGWLAVRLVGLTKGNSKNNAFGLGATLEVRSGRAYQFREATGDVTHFGLGRLEAAAVLRVVWTNGVPQNRLEVQKNQAIVEEQLLKGSCPFLYTWTGERVEFVTDLLWGAPIGLPVAPGVWAGADPEELVRVDGAAPDRGVYRLYLTEELWEAAYFDLVRLWVVDHPAAVEVASSLKILPGRRVPEAVLGSRGLRSVAAAWDGRGEEVTARVERRDEVYADGYSPTPYQGMAAGPWAFTFDLGEAPAGPVRLHLDGWIFPTDASLNLALAQRPDLAPLPPRLEVETARGWQVLMPEMGFPAGKTKTMVVDTPPLPPGARRLRIVTSMWLSWDRIAWTTAPADREPVVVARLAPSQATLRFRGFSAPVRRAPNAPHSFDYGEVSTASPWLPFPGRYTRYGEVAPLLLEADDRSVILAAGDEVALAFDAAQLPPPPPGWRRTVFLESHGWDKDADRNTFAAQGVEPLPFRAMSGYPYGPGEAYPDTPEHREYRERWLTREVTAEPAGPLDPSP